MQRFFFFLAMISVFNAGQVQAQISDFKTKADSLAQILYGNFSDEEKITANQHLELLTNEFLQSDSSQYFTYDSLLFVKHLLPEDGSFALLGWVVPLDGDHYLYSGFLQKISNSNVDMVFQFTPASNEVKANTKYTLQDWPPAVYNKILPQGKKENYYTLFGWVGQADGLSGKRIETLTFDSLGQPVFGVPVFRMKNGNNQCRVDFEYTSEVPFHLGYELQRLPGEKRKTGWMIVFNRIGGNIPGMGRAFRGPVPSFDVFDAFVKVGENWVLFEDIDPRADTKDLDDSPPTEIGLPEWRKK